MTLKVEDDPEDEKQNIVEDPLRFPFGRIGDSSTSSGDLSGSSKFGDRNYIDQESGQTDSDVKIWYGDDATEGEFPFMVRLRKTCMTEMFIQFSSQELEMDNSHDVLTNQF